MPLENCYLNGEYLRLSDARISPLDRGFLFADAVYEVLPVYAGRPFRLRQHLDRLNRSLEAISMPPPLPHRDWAAVCAELIGRNGGGDLYLYIQVTRGAEFGRNHAWPEGLVPTLFAYANTLDPTPVELLSRGVAAITADDTRWARRDIKSTALLANVLLKRRASDAGAYEAILLERGCLTEGASTSVLALIDGALCMPPNGTRLLPGITRELIVELCPRIDLTCRERTITEAELRNAQEIWLAFTTRGLLPVTRLDGAPIGGGVPGPVFARMRAAFERHVAEQAGGPWL